ncbi:MAG: DUF4276 family protein [Bacteroidetes bacterium]|nr:MAG: DUF4276 family protein [Bacteroidota bacterium]
MPRIEILTEEASIKEVLEIILPKILSEKWILGENYFVRAHEGKSDLQKSIPKKMQVFSNFHEPAGVVVVQDQDSSDCLILKNKLLELCQKNGNCPTLIRIVCRELESWYLGDMLAIEKSYPSFKADKYLRKMQFRNPDLLNNASQELRKMLPEFQKVASAKAISPNLNLDLNHNHSESFKQFISGIIRFFAQFE